MKRRVLEKLKIDEISGVDRPAQEGARFVIMKRNNPQQETNMNIVAHPTPAPSPPPEPPMKSFDALAAEIKKRDNCSRTDALAKARHENPAAFGAYQDGPANDDFYTLVAAEIAKGCPAAVAAQRVALRYPNATVIAKKGKTPFEDLVASIMEQDNVPRSVAMSRARRKEPAMFAHFQAQ